MIVSFDPDPDQFQSSSPPKPIKKVEEDDNFRQELSTALQMETNIVPVTDNFQWPEPDSLPEVGKISFQSDTQSLESICKAYQG